jgi:choline dehydrogenase-like flavoprotein
MQVIVVGAGIGGLSLALSLHQAGITVRVYEAVRDLAPLGVGINLQPTAVRELTEMGLAEELQRVGNATERLSYSTSMAVVWETTWPSLPGTTGRNTPFTEATCSLCCYVLRVRNWRGQHPNWPVTDQLRAARPKSHRVVYR